MSDDYLALKALGALLGLIASAAIRFDRPTHARTFTSRNRFLFGTVMYVGVYVSAFVLVFALAKQGIRWFDAPTVRALSRPSTPLWIALGIMMLALAVPAVEAPLRRAIQRLVGIPGSADALARKLVVANFLPRPKVADEAREMLRSRSIDVDQAWLDEAVPAQEQLLRATVVYLELREWQNDARAAGFMDRASLEVDHLKQRFDRLSISAARIFGCIEQVGEIRLAMNEPVDCAVKQRAAVDVGCRKLVEDLLVDLCSDAVHFHSDACHLLARGLVMTEPSANRRNERLHEMGFRLEDDSAFGRYAVLGLASMLLFIGVTLYFAIFGVDHKHPLVLITVITLIQTGALALGSLPKTRWGFADAGLAPTAPPLFVVGAGLAALLWAMLVNFSAGAVVNGWPGIVERLRDGWPYLPMPFATAATTAWLVQDFRWGAAASPMKKRAYDALALGVVWVFASMLCNGLKQLPELSSFDIGTFGGYVGSFVFGAVLGAVVPGIFRDPQQLPVSASSRLEQRPRIRARTTAQLASF